MLVYLATLSFKADLKVKNIGTNGTCEDMPLIKEIGQTLKRKLHDHIFVLEVI